jgi:hypothetical protein
MSLDMPKIVGYKIMTPDLSAVISEHGPHELEHCRNLIQNRIPKHTKERPAGNVLQYIFEQEEK